MAVIGIQPGRSSGVIDTSGPTLAELAAKIKAVEESLAGTWLNCVPAGGAFTAGEVLARFELANSVIRLRGSFLTQIALKVETKFMTLPAGIVPKFTRFVWILNASTGSTSRMTVNALGECNFVGPEIPAKGGVVSVDNTSFSI